MKNMFVQQMKKKHLATAVLAVTIAACTVSGCSQEAMNTSTKNTVIEQTIEDKTQTTAEGALDLSEAADMGTVTMHPDSEKPQPADGEMEAARDDTTQQTADTDASTDHTEEPHMQDTSVSSDAPAGQDTSASTASGNKDSSTASGSNASAADTKTPSKEQNKAEQAPAQMAQNTQPQPEQAEQTPEALPSVPPVPQPQESQPATEKPKPASCTHNWQAVSHEETVCTQAEWYEYIKDGRIIARDGTDITEFYGTSYYDEEGLWHDPFTAAILEHGGSYSCKEIVVETIHHDPVYETKTVFDYYECPNCGLILGEADYNRIYGNQQ